MDNDLTKVNNSSKELTEELDVLLDRIKNFNIVKKILT